MGLLDRMSFGNREPDPPEAIEIGEKGEFRIIWPGGARATISATRLRELCPCAGCVEEGTGRRLLDPATIPADIRPLRISAVGNYAVGIEWSDGHSTGIFTWRALRNASEL